VNFAVDLICTSEEFLFNKLLVKHILIHSILSYHCYAWHNLHKYNLKRGQLYSWSRFAASV